MAVLSANNPTLLDLATRQDPDGKIAAVVELLNETNEILADMSWVEGNLPTGHKSTVRTGLPTPTWRKMYGGVQPTKSRTAQVIDNCGMLEMYAEIDKALADLNGNKAAWRLSEERAFVEGLNQEVADTLFYGNEGTEPEAFTGLAPRYNSLSAESADNIIKDSNGTPDTSMWLVVWGPNTIHGIIPKGSTAGLQVRDLGEVTLEDASGGSNTGRMQAYRTHYRWDVGLTVRDWRYAVRIQFDIGNLTNVFASGAFASSANLPDLMFQAMRRIPSLSQGRAAFYMSRDIASWVARQKAAMGLSSYATEETVAGAKRWTEMFNGIPIRRVDALATTETAIS